ncbi:MAG: D-2-hydroxyacid dehydrogenase [Pseudomonadota bacterium]|nr:D-2-hydroxyacid dehydrogenase [Pseudomonadota bacterium]
MSRPAAAPAGVPRVTVLLAPEEPSLPGLAPVAAQARLREVRDPAALATALASTDVLVVTDFRSGALAERWPAHCPVRWVHATSAGVDGLAIPAILAGEVLLTNARGVFDRGIAEYVLGAVLLFAKDTLGNVARQRARRWEHRESALIRGARALIVGAGSIGSEVARLLQALDMQVSGVARSARVQAPFDRVHAHHELPALLPQADYVIITAPLTPQTHHLFDAAMLARLRPGACLINVGRGPIVEESALVRALQSGAIAGAALDVFEHEPLPPDHPLWTFDNVMISAHMAGDFRGWRRALGEQFVANFARWQRGERLTNRVLPTGITPC